MQALHLLLKHLVLLPQQRNNILLIRNLLFQSFQLDSANSKDRFELVDDALDLVEGGKGGEV